MPSCTVDHGHQRRVVGVARDDFVTAGLLDGHRAARRVHAERLALREAGQLHEDRTLRQGRAELALVECHHIELGRLVHHQLVVGDIDRRRGVLFGPETFAVRHRVVQRRGRPSCLACSMERDAA
jgi:hypothetical protein